MNSRMSRRHRIARYRVAHAWPKRKIAAMRYYGRFGDGIPE